MIAPEILLVYFAAHGQAAARLLDDDAVILQVFARARRADDVNFRRRAFRSFNRHAAVDAGNGDLRARRKREILIDFVALRQIVLTTRDARMSRRRAAL